MKKRLFLLSVLLLTESLAFRSAAIVPVPIQDSLLQLEIASQYVNLEKNRVPSGLLLDYGVNYVDFKAFDGTNMTDSSRVNMATMELILKTIRNSSVGATMPIGQVHSIISQMSTAYHSGTNPVSIVLYQYNQIKQTALAENLVSYSEQSGVQDVYLNQVWQNPYLNKTVAAFTPYMNIVRGLTVVYSFDSSFRFTNRSITGVQFDAGDGVGYRTITNGSNVSITYSSTGRKYLKLKIQYGNNEEVELCSDILVEETITPPSSSFTVDATQSFTASTSYMGYQPSATVSIKYASTNTSGTIKTPLILAEGFDPFTFRNQGKGENHIEKYHTAIENSLSDYYDIVYIDWGNSMAPIQANADILRQIVTWVNSNKAADASSNLLIGESMGGLISRYALCTMESAGTPHDVSTFLCHDVPHLGVNVPLGALYAAQHFYSDADLLQGGVHALDVLFTVIGLLWSDASTAYNEFMSLRDAPSVRQMLINYVNENYQIDNSLYSSFQNELRQMGFPHGDTGKRIKLLTYSNGGAQDYGSVQHFASFSVSANAGIALKGLLNILLPGVVYGMDLINLGLWGLIPGSTTYNYDLAISPYSANDVEVYREASIYHKTNFLGTFDRTLYINVFRSPATGVPMDVVKGSYYSFRDSTISYSLPIGSPLLGGASLSFTLQNRFMFVPTVSSLCYKKGNSPLTLNDYNYDFWNNGVDFSQIPFDGYKLSRQTSAYHTNYEKNALAWAKDCSPLTITGPTTGATGSVYSVNTTNPVSWTTSDSQIATISSTGVLHKMGFGTVDVIATILIDSGELQLRKTVTIPAPTFPGFPTYHLNKQDLTAPGVVLDTYPFTVTAQRQNSIGSEFYSYFTYYWGEKVGSSPITWTTSSSLTYYTSVPAFTQKTVYFKAYYNGQYSSTYSTTVKHMEIMDPVGLDGDGVLHFDDGEDGDGETLQVKGAVGENTYSYLIDGHCFVFDYVATSRELCQAMLQCSDLVARIKTLRPWGEEEILAVNYVRTDSDSEEEVEGVILFFYQDNDSE